MAGFVPAIRAFLAQRLQEKTLMPATSAGMTPISSHALSRAMTRLEALIPGQAQRLLRNPLRAPRALHQIVGWFVGRFVEQLMMSLA
jgi:hypothetical protein